MTYNEIVDLAGQMGWILFGWVLGLLTYAWITRKGYRSSTTVQKPPEGPGSNLL